MKFLKWFFIVLGLAILLCAAYFVFAVVQFRGGEVRDLGIKYGYRDYTEAVANKAQVLVKDPAALYLGSTFRSEGVKHIDAEFTNAEISAIQNYSNETSGPFRDVQIAFHQDGTMEASGMVTDQRINAPIYAKGKVDQTSPTTFNIDATEIAAGQYSLPAPLQKIVNTKFSNYINEILKNIPGLKVEKIEFKEGAVKFVGDVPAKIF